MKCVRCGKEFDKDYKKFFCDNCGGVIKCSVGGKLAILLLLLIIMAGFIKNDILLALIGLLLIINFISWVVISIIETVQQMKCYKKLDDITNISKTNEQPEQISETEFLSYFLSSDKYRKKDDVLERGECKIKIFAGDFTINQDDKKIENLIDSIYYFGIWDFKNETYFKFRMKDLNEIKFKSINSEVEQIAALLKSKGVKIEDDRK